MRINKLDSVFQVYNKNANVKNAKSDKINQEKDQIRISEKAVEFQFALQKIKDVEEIRMDKVESIKNQIKSGTYEIDGQKIAEKMLASINFDKKI